MPKKSIDLSWLTTLTQHVESKPCGCCDWMRATAEGFTPTHRRIQAWRKYFPATAKAW